MSLRTLEKAIVEEAKLVTKNNKLKLKHLMEWCTTNVIKKHEGETIYYLPELQIYAAFKTH